MNIDFCRLLVCPDCQVEFQLEVTEGENANVSSGTLRCLQCNETYPIINGVPRFVADAEQYCENFGWQWQKFRRTQIDAFNGLKESETRFTAETGWNQEELKGALVLDAGCGAGRFSAIAAQFGANVVAVDISNAVDACSSNMKELGHDVQVVQASLYRLPFRHGTFDRIFSLGVIQHTPDPGLTIRTLPLYLKPHGRLALWIYEKRWTRFLMSRNLIRHFTRNLSRRANYGFSFAAVSLLFPVTATLSLIPGLRKAVPLVPISGRHYWGKMSLKQQWEWTLLDTFDSYSAAHEHCQREEDVINELQSAGMHNVFRSPARGMAIVGERAASNGTPIRSKVAVG